MLIKVKIRMSPSPHLSNLGEPHDISISEITKRRGSVDLLQLIQKVFVFLFFFKFRYNRYSTASDPRLYIAGLPECRLLLVNITVLNTRVSSLNRKVLLTLQDWTNSEIKLLNPSNELIVKRKVVA